MTRISFKLQQLMAFLLSLTSVLFYSLPFYLILYVLVSFVLLFSLIVPNIFVNLLCVSAVTLCFLHGWKAFSHVLEDYTFSALLRPIFVTLSHLILFRSLFIIWF